MTTQKLERQTFETSRELEYFNEKELTVQTGHPPSRWPEVVVKELVDNALDACESREILPHVQIDIRADSICVTDNGPGLPGHVVDSILDFNLRVSSKDAYIGPTRGAQGNALKTVAAIPYVLSDCLEGMMEITSSGDCHRIKVAVDRIAQKPQITHETVPDDVVKNGSRVKVVWPVLAPLKLDELESRFLQLLAAYSLFNPHATFELQVGGRPVARYERTADKCRKWLANEPTSPHWYTADQLRGLMAAYITAERHGGTARTVREFVAEFRGLSATAKQKTILDRLNLSGVYLRDLVKDGDLDRAVVQTLLEAMRAESKPVKPLGLGVIGEEHFKTWLETYGGEIKTFHYKRIANVDDQNGLPFIVEFAFVLRKDRESRRLITGINWAPTLADPFRYFSAYGFGLDGLLNSLHINASDPVTFVLHLACPHLKYTDRGKSSLEGL